MSNKRIFKSNIEPFIFYSVSLLISLLILFAMAAVLWTSLKIESWGKLPIYTLQNYVTFFGNPRILLALWNTILTSLGAVLFSTFIGCSIAWLNARTDMPFRNFFNIANTIPLFLSPLVVSIGWIFLAAPRVGVLNKFFDYILGFSFLDIYGIPGMIWVFTLHSVPTVYLLTVGALTRMDPSLEDSARACGATLFQSTFKITIPLIYPAIISAMILIFVTSAGGFAVPLTLGMPYGKSTLVTIIFEFLQSNQPNYNIAAASGSILLLATIFLTYLARKMVLKKSYITVTGKGYRPRVIPLGKWKYLALSWNFLYFLLIFLPIFMLFIISFHRIWIGIFDFSKITLKNYHELLFIDDYSLTGFKNSLQISLLGATIAIFACGIISYFIYRTRLFGKEIVEYIASLPMAIPGLVLALGCLIIFIRTPLYATMWILLVSYIIHFIPYGMRSISPVLLSLSPELDESSRGCGATLLKTLKNITFPLLKPGIIAGWMLLFILFFREVPISMLLWSSGNHVMSVVLWQLLEHRNAAITSAYAILQVGITLIVLIFIQKLSGRGEVGSTH